jgi:hypothetical protein
MAKKLQLELTGAGKDLVFIGIASPLKDYLLCYRLNKKLGFRFKKLPDLLFTHPGKNEPYNYSLYHHKNTDRLLDYFLLTNHHPDSKLLPIFKQTDYFLLVSGEANANETEKMIKDIRTIQDVMLSYYLDHTKAKEMELILSDLELHVMEVNRKQLPTG